MTPDAASKIAPDAETAFILGNGPSLAGVDLRALNSAAFGMNAAYRYWREIDWRPSHYVCLDLVVGMSHRDAIAELIDEGRIGAFLLRDNLVAALGERARSAKIVNFDSLSARDAMFDGVSITTGSGAALWAATLGYRQLVMLGIDGRYKEIVEGAEKRDGNELEIVRTASNPNYFHDKYQQPGDRYNLPNPRPELHVTAWREAGRNLLAAGARIYNGSPDSAVRCFPFIDAAAFMRGGAAPTPADEPLTTADAAPPETGRRRLAAFGRRYVAVVTGWGIALGALLALWAFSASPAPLELAAAAIAAGLFFAASLAGLYVRFALVNHLNRLSGEVARLKARIRDLERLER